MKLHRLILAILLIGLLGCQSKKNASVITGKILGKIPEKVEYTKPINGICDWSFTGSVQPDSLGNFEISIEYDKAIFVKLRTSYTEQGILIVEPGKTYDVVFDLNKKENVFSVADKSSVVQEAYNKFPNLEHIQLGAREFMRDSVASRIKETIEQRRASEIAQFEKFRADQVISEEVFRMVKTDRNCYYDAVLATTAWLKDYMSIQRGLKMFTPDFENLWKETFKQPLFADPEIMNSPWFNFYAECYIYFKEFMDGEFTMKRIEELSQAKQTKIDRVNKAHKYLPKEICENYLAYYLYDESSQKEYEKELIDLYADFKTQYPKSGYNSYISPLIDEIVKFYQVSGSGFSEKTKFVKNYQNLKSLAEIAKTMDERKIFIDVWATWCGPCKAEFEHKEALRPLLEKNNIQTLYISIDKEKDSTQWKNMIKFYKLEGSHVLANKELVAELRKLYDQNGSIAIPWYILIDSKGNIIKMHVSPPSQIAKLEQEIAEK
jgi:thiol-disulfide isomerase/thioredoxin